MCAMTPPIAGKDVTPRFKRHFFVLAISEFEDNVMITIFSRIVLWHLDTRFVTLKIYNKNIFRQYILNLFQVNILFYENL